MEYGLIGEKLGHSFSREIHEKLGDYKYELCELTREGVISLMKERQFRAINVTIPYKETVIVYLDEMSESAKKIGAVNTVVNRGGRLYGYNTDYYGAMQLFLHSGVRVTDKKVLILGTGGTSKTMRSVVSDMGAREIIVVSRHEGEGVITYEKAKACHSDAEVIVNTTPVGMYPNSDACPIDIECFPRLCGVIDVIYNPLDTQLILKAKARGIAAEGGLYMLVAQGVMASALFTGKDADTSVLDKIYGEVLSEKQKATAAFKKEK